MNDTWSATFGMLLIVNIILAFVLPITETNTLVFIRGLFLGSLIMMSIVLFIDSIKRWNATR